MCKAPMFASIELLPTDFLSLDASCTHEMSGIYVLRRGNHFPELLQVRQEDWRVFTNAWFVSSNIN